MPAVATKLYLVTKFPKRPPTPQDKTYLCYEATTPPWEKEIVYVEDSHKRSWFVHESDIELTEPALKRLLHQVKDEYNPTTPEALRRRHHNPLIIHIVLSRVASFDELAELLGTVSLRPVDDK